MPTPPILHSPARPDPTPSDRVGSLDRTPDPVVDRTLHRCEQCGRLYVSTTSKTWWHHGSMGLFMSDRWRPGDEDVTPEMDEPRLTRLRRRAAKIAAKWAVRSTSPTPPDPPVEPFDPVALHEILRLLGTVERAEATVDECWSMWLDAKHRGDVCTCDDRDPADVFDDEADELFSHLVRTAMQQDDPVTTHHDEEAA